MTRREEPLENPYSHPGPGREEVSSSRLAAAVGIDSVVFHRLLPDLAGLFSRVKSRPDVAARYLEWRDYTASERDPDVDGEPLFLRHTYLALLARLIARRFLAPSAAIAGSEEMLGILNGDYFRGQALDNFIEDDFFTWLLSAPARDEGLDLVGRLAGSLARFNFTRVPPDLMTGLYETLTKPARRSTPERLARYILEEKLGLSGNPDRRALDPCCGDGAFLFAALRLIIDARRSRGEDDFDILLHVTDQVMGMDTDPLSVTFARVRYLLALDGLARQPHPPALIPVYLADAVALPEPVADSQSLAAGREPVYRVATSDPEAVFEVPHSVAASLDHLDWIFSRLTNYISGAELRRHMQSEEDAIQEVLNALHNYLVAPKPRTPIPEALSYFAAEVMERAAGTLMKLNLVGKDHIWLHILKNAPAPVSLAGRKFDLVVGNACFAFPGRAGALPERVRRLTRQSDSVADTSAPPSGGDPDTGAENLEATVSPGHFAARCARLYLAEQGRLALVTPASPLDLEERGRLAGESVNLEGFNRAGSILEVEEATPLAEAFPELDSPRWLLVARKTPERGNP